MNSEAANSSSPRTLNGQTSNSNNSNLTSKKARYDISTGKYFQIWAFLLEREIFNP